MIRSCIRIRIALILLGASLALAFGGAQAQARNVPGSASAATQDLSEIITDEMADAILDALDGDGGAGVGGVSQDASGNVTISSMGGGFLTEGGTFGGVRLTYRDLDIDGEIEGDMLVGAATLGQRLDGGVVVFASLLIEELDVDTPYNSGTVESTGYGLALGAATRNGAGLNYSATFGLMELDYDVTRSAGAVSGNYEASRWFVDLRGTNSVFLESTQVDYDFGLRHVRQSDDAYTETGGGAVAAQDYDSTVAFLNTRTHFGADMAARPYLQGDMRYVFNDNASLPGIGSTSSEGLRGYLGLGMTGDLQGLSYDAGLGGHFNEDGYAGLGARLSVNLRF